MQRYVSIPTGWMDVDTDGYRGGKAVDHLARTIHEEDRQPTYTGLLDAKGVKLYRLNEKDPIGFHSSSRPDPSPAGKR